MRARSLKPGLFKNELLGTMDPLLTILFEGLWCLADREGRLEDRPLRIKAEVFPYREGLDVNGYLTELERLDFIERYEVAGDRFIQVITFPKHQNPHKTERPSIIPLNPHSCPTTVKEPLDNGSLTEVAVLTPSSLTPSSLTPDSKKPPTPLPVYEIKNPKSYNDLDEETKTCFFELSKKVLKNFPGFLIYPMITNAIQKGRRLDAIKVGLEALSDSHLHIDEPAAYFTQVVWINHQNFNEADGIAKHHELTRL